MPIDARSLSEELKRLRKGSAMRDPQIIRRLGSQVRSAFQISEADSAAVVRRKARELVASSLASDHRARLGALVALNLHTEAQQRLLKDRTAWLASRLVCQERTARRLIDAALQKLVDACVEREHAAVVPERRHRDGYAVRVFRATLWLDGPAPRLREQRGIVVTAPALTHITLRLTVPPPVEDGAEGEVTARMLTGGTIVAARRLADQTFEFDLQLPTRLNHGQTHEYCVEFLLPPGRRLRPHCVFQPLVACEAFELEVHFARTELPAAIWLVDGALPRVLDVPARVAHSGEQPLNLDPSGVLRLTFADLQPGFSYGARWQSLDG